ncbi:hypothetical protein GTY65_24230 [Streptomyces sp. SID8379]|uniref:NucA/NucB deoxyribonuclease domain-containing protein n=1 Tax=unclassified Streptomyces TaxID=2593676 RepID=UPI00131A087F|nr:MULTISPECIES: hypothetical protein [unclassified Streptomyces]MYW67151.1 hypothetical protein [Streptomyces sp. SID8379]
MAFSALGALSLLAATVQESSAAPVAAQVRETVPSSAGQAPRPAEGAGVELAGQTCDDVTPSMLSSVARTGEDEIFCLRDAKPVPETTVKATTAPPQLQNAVGACDTSPNLYFYDRFTGCVNTKVSYEVIDTKTGKVTGTASFTAIQDVTLLANDSMWHSEVSLRQDSATGTATGLTAAWQTTCDSSACTSSDNAWTGSQPISVGKVLDGATTLTWAAGSGINQQKFGFKNTITINAAGAVLINPAWFAFPQQIRCDNDFGSGTRMGCVFPNYIPTLDMAITHAGHANVAWSMNNLIDKWGWQGKGQPLTREKNTTIRDQNRAKICEDGTWKAMPDVVPTDSCDEFAFAATNQSGGQLQLTGKDCAQIRPAKENGQWVVYYYGSVTSKRCTIGHVPLAENVSVGGSLSTFYQGQRVLDDEKFWLYVH